MSSTASLYFHTLRSLRPAQVLGRVWRVAHKPRVDLASAPERRVVGHWHQPTTRRVSWLSETRRRFLNVERECIDVSDWDSPDVPKLWLYNLHYFEDLCADNPCERMDWHSAGIARWITEIEPGRGTGWEPYPLSLRIVNWIKWELGRGCLSRAAVQSLAVQARYLRSNLEHHLLGNHLMTNAKALVFAGCFFEGPEAEAWLAKGLRLIQRELDEQVLHDGGHFERSPMYHSLLLEDLLDLINLACATPQAFGKHWPSCVEQLKHSARRMRRWLLLMTHPDGQLALFNDCAAGIAPTPDELYGYARRLGLGPAPLPSSGIHVLPYSGFVRVETVDALALLDVGEIGPSYLPGHAHADSLSFEFSLFGTRVAVNSGTSLYAPGAERLRQRSTSAHNTVVVDGQNSSEVWSSFRVARRAHPHELLVEDTPHGARIRCSHDGYMRLPGRVVHRREWVMGPASFAINDALIGEFDAALALIHLHPDVQIESDSEFRLAGGERLLLDTQGTTRELQDSTWHPEFGLARPNQRVALPFHERELRTTLSW